MPVMREATVEIAWSPLRYAPKSTASRIAFRSVLTAGLDAALYEKPGSLSVGARGDSCAGGTAGWTRSATTSAGGFSGNPGSAVTAAATTI